ncbi:MAG: DUF1015 domain-containing protein [Clostridia bacterium]|nr:DUF1015 domain-containing protein [Clostridia bacterium]
MYKLKKGVNDVGLRPAEILLPNVPDMTSFSCIACDQFTGDKKFWQTFENSVKGKPTALDLIFPEVYLSDEPEKRIEKINANIEKYLKDGVFKKLDEGFILTVRSTPFVKRRIGIIGALDLDKYEYGKKTETLIRATEGVIEERIPPRLKIRENAPVEFPHVMVLYDDEKKQIAEHYYEIRESLEKLYDFELSMGGGRVEGYFIKDVDDVIKRFSELLTPERLKSKYGKVDNFAFAVGDGNHSLATAKAHWERVKKTLSEKERENHPARYALAEFNNVYDEGIYFEPIFRFVSGVNANDFIVGAKEKDFGDAIIYCGGKEIKLNGKNELPQGISAADEYIKDFVSKNGGEVDYIHGESQLKQMVDGDENAFGILFKKLKKEDLFRYVSEKGSFPKKTFSMGEGIEKRYYIEGRKIK